MSEEKEIENFVANYEDGSQRTINKGFLCEIQELPDGECNLHFSMAGVSGQDLKVVVFGCLQLGKELGMFEGKN